MSFEDFLTWVKVKEPSITDASIDVLTVYYNEAITMCNVMSGYLTNIYTYYIYNNALHNAIVSSVYMPALENSQNDNLDTEGLDENGYALTSRVSLMGYYDDDTNNINDIDNTDTSIDDGVDNLEDNNTNDEIITTISNPTELQLLYQKYGVYNYQSHIITSSSGAGVSGSGQLPNGVLQMGTVDTNMYLSTPYGIFVEQANQDIPCVL